MIKSNYLSSLPLALKNLIGVFLLVLSIGYFSALVFVNKTTSTNPLGIVENYNGNEDNELAEEMKFKKSDHEMLNIIHTHILSMSVIFFILGFLVYGAGIPSIIKSFLMIEPLISVIVTFGGIYMIWYDVEWMTYLVMLSGALMTMSFVAGVIVILYSMYLNPYIK